MSLKIVLRIGLLIAIAAKIPFNVSGQNCSDLRYVDPLFDVSTTFNIEFQQARPYGSLLNQPYRLNLYEPVDDTLSYRPLMIFQFGGGYLIGDRLLPPAPAFCSYWAERGFVVASIDYRLGFSAVNQGSAERAVYRGVQDLQAALRYLCEFSDTYGVDTNNIIVSGNSAGAFTTLHSTFMEQSQAPASYQGFGIGLDSYSLGGIYESGNTYWGNREVKVHGIIANWGAILDTSLIGDAPDDNVATILFHGTADDLVPYVYGQPFDSPFFPEVYGSVPIAERLANTTIPHKFVPLIGAGHEPELLNDAYLDTILWESQDFMYENVLQPQIQSVNGLTSPLLNTTSVYTVIANEQIIQVCATANNGTVVSTNQNQVEVQWTTAGLDTLQIIAGNEILAYDTAYVPVEVISLVGAEELTETNLATIQPNVFSDQTVVRFAETPSERSILVITNMLGQPIFTDNIVANRISLFANQLGKGFYLAYLEESNKRQFIGRLVVQ
jgi:dienelactone hydrolase